MKYLITLLLACLTTTAIGQEIKALVGGHLIDGFGSDPLANSVIIINIS